MSKIYDNAFKIGVTVNILVFLILNFVSFIISYEEYLQAEGADSLTADIAGDFL